MLSVSSRIKAVGLTLVFGLSLLAPLASGQAAPVVPLTGQTVTELYVAGDALGGPMATQAPTAENAKRKSLIATAINPGLATTITVATFQPAEDMTFASDVATTVYLVANTAMVYDQIQVNLVGTGLSGTTSSTPLTAPAAIQTNIVNLRLGIPAMGQTVKAGTKVNLNIVLFGVGAGGTQTDLYLVYDGKSQPTGITFATTTPGAFPSQSSAFMAYMDDKRLTPTAPTGAADKSAKAYEGACTGSCFGSVPAWEWGKMVVPTDMVVSAETVFTAWLAPPGGAGAMRGITVTLVLGKSTVSTASGAITRTWSTATPAKFVVSLPTRGLELAAGDEIKLQWALWTTSDAAEVRAYYGSVGKPAGLMIPIVGGGASAEPVGLNLTAPSTQLTGPAGGAAAGLLNISNPGTDSVNVTINATGDADVAFVDPGPYSVAGGNTTDIAFEVDLSDAAPSDVRTITLIASIDGVELGNLTYTIVATASQPTQSGGPNATGPSSTTNGTSGGPKATDSEAGVPALGPLATIAALVSLVVALRRRRA